MTKKDYYTDIYPLINARDKSELENYLLEHSNMPGRMANITLVSVVADIMGSDTTIASSWYPTLSEWFRRETTGDDPETLLVLCAVESFGAIYNQKNGQSLIELEHYFVDALNDGRWRVREIVTETYKRIGINSYTDLEILFNWILQGALTPLEMRGLLATVAHPDILKTTEQLNYAQMMMERAFDYYLNFDATTYSKEDKIVLKKGLSFAPSVIISKNPEQGFAFFEELIEKNEKQLKPILKNNLKKKRVESVDSEKVAELLNRLL